MIRWHVCKKYKSIVLYRTNYGQCPNHRSQWLEGGLWELKEGELIAGITLYAIEISWSSIFNEPYVEPPEIVLLLKTEHEGMEAPTYKLKQKYILNDTKDILMNWPYHTAVKGGFLILIRSYYEGNLILILKLPYIFSKPQWYKSVS